MLICWLCTIWILVHAVNGPGTCIEIMAPCVLGKRFWYIFDPKWAESVGIWHTSLLHEKTGTGTGTTLVLHYGIDYYHLGCQCTVYQLVTFMAVCCFQLDIPTNKPELWIRTVFIFSGSGSRVWCWRPIRIRIRIPDPDPDPIRIQGFNDQKLKKNYSRKFFIIFFFDRKLQFTYP